MTLLSANQIIYIFCANDKSNYLIFEHLYKLLKKIIILFIECLSYGTPFVAKFNSSFIQYSMQIQCIQFNDFQCSMQIQYSTKQFNVQ